MVGCRRYKRLIIMKWLKVVGLSLVLLVSGCQSVSTTNSGAVGVHREQKMFTMLSEQEVNKMSAEAYQEQLAKARKAKVLNQDAENLQRLHRIGDDLIAQVGVFRPDAKNWKWEINLMKDEQLNAYCMPGGKIMFYSGIIDKLKLTDDEIAAIMGHEMAHALREHGREGMSQAYAVAMGRSAVGALLGLDPQLMRLGDTVVNYALTLPNSRTNEAEADLIGLELMARAGYNPQAAVTLWQKMDKESGGNKPPEFMSTHPANETRIQGLQANIHKVEAYYQQARKK